MSVIQQTQGGDVELVISDNSPGSESTDVVQSALGAWPGRWTYMHNETTIPMIANINQAISRSIGDYVLILSDDDYLLPGSLQPSLEFLQEDLDRPACLFGGQIVDKTERVLKRSSFPEHVFLEPADALDRLFADSGFVRSPAMIVNREALVDVGMFDPSTHNVCDIDLWFKLFSRHGLHCVPVALSAYTVHRKAFTMSKFNTKTIDLLLDVFARAEASGAISPAEAVRYRALFLHQYILAGTYRSLRWQGFSAAQKVFGLFAHEDVRELPVPGKWSAMRTLFGLLLGRPRIAMPSTRDS